jgi:predicted aspartyl protease
MIPGSSRRLQERTLAHTRRSQPTASSKKAGQNREEKQAVSCAEKKSGHWEILAHSVSQKKSFNSN